MTRIKELAKEGGFTNQEEIIKFLFLIHNNNTKVREYLIDKAEPSKTSYDFLVLAKTIESQTQTESMSRKLLEKVSNTPVAAVQRNRSKTPFRPKSRPQSGTRGSSPSPGRQCGKCGFKHPPRKCPAFGKVCNSCKGRNHFWRVCKKTKSKPQGNPKYRTSRKDQYEVGTEHAPYYQSDFEFEEDCIQIEFSKGTFNKGTDGPKGNIMFDEVTNTQALGDLTLSNRAGKVEVTRFKLDSGAGANLLPVGTYYKLFNKKDSEYLWTGTHEQAFQRIKSAVCESTLLSYYDKTKPIFIEVDASGQGLGAVLLQGNVSSEELKQASQTEGKYLKFRNRLKPIAFASKSLSEAEQRYSNIERELLGVVWAIQHFNHYTFANKINIISDHKPLQPLFSGKSLTSCSPRTARLLLKVIDRDVRFFYQQGPSMYLSDPLSRLSSHNIQDGNKEEVQGLKVNICDITSVKNVTLDQFKEHTASDEDFQLLKMYVMHGWPSAQQDCVEQLRSYFTFKEEIAFIDGLLFKGNRLIVPKALRNKTLQVLHRSHMGIIKTQERARTSFYWPGLNIAIKSICQSCETCLQYAAKQDKQEIGLVPDCSESWEALATDIFEFQGKFFLIVSCRFSSYMVVREMAGHTAEETIDKLSSIFAELGLPRTLHCDRGTNYTSSKFQDFCKGLNIKVTYSSAEHHSSNYAERGVQTVKQFMRKTEEWQMALLEYLMTPIRLQGTQSSPLQLMKKRTIRGILPVRQQGTCSSDYERKLSRRQEQAKYQSGSQYKPLAMGSSILYYDHDKSQWVPGVLVEKIHDRSYVIISQKGRKVTRNRIDIKPYPGKVQVHFETPKVPMTSPTIMSKQASSSSHRPFHHNNTFNANATSTPSSITSSTKSSMSLPKIQTQTLSSHHDTKSCSLKNRDPIHNRDVPQHQPGIQLRNQSAKSAKTQGKLAITADKSKSSMPQQTRSGWRVTKPKRYED